MFLSRCLSIIKLHFGIFLFSTFNHMFEWTQNSICPTFKMWVGGILKKPCTAKLWKENDSFTHHDEVLLQNFEMFKMIRSLKLTNQQRRLENSRLLNRSYPWNVIKSTWKNLEKYKVTKEINPLVFELLLYIIIKERQ